MQFHEIDSVGKIWIQRLSVLPDWTTADVGRLVLVMDGSQKNSVYFGGTLEYGDWVSVSEYYIDEGTGVDPDTNLVYTDRPYEMKIVNGSIRLYY